MADRTGIEWTHRPGTIGSSWNPWRGCDPVSEGCDNCYMFREQRRYGRDPAVVVRSKTTFNDPLTWDEPHTIFTCSWSDWFHKTADQWRPEAWDIVDRTRHHQYLILTKRIGRAHRHLPANWGEGYANCELGTSVELPKYLYRIEQLLAVPAASRFLSLEPLLGPLDIRPWLALGGIDWVIVGGESETDEKRRDCEIEWIASVVEQCDAFGVPPFVKQDSGRVAGLQGRIPEVLWRRKEFPKAVAA